LAFEAEVAEVEGIDPLDKGGEVFLFVGDEAGFEVPFKRAFGPDAGPGEVGGADEGFDAIDDDGFGVDTGAEDAFEEVALDEGGVAVEVLAKAGAGFFGVEEADGDALVDEVGEDFEEGDEAAAFFDVEVFEVGGDDPEEFLGPGEHVHDNAFVDFFVEDEVGHRGWQGKAAEGR
jgi:hypothetical protein